jgi:hypothetical protein
MDVEIVTFPETKVAVIEHHGLGVIPTPLLLGTIAFGDDIKLLVFQGYFLYCP